MWQGWGPLLVYDWEMQDQAGLSTLHIGMAGWQSDEGSDLESRGALELRQASPLSKSWFAWSIKWWNPMALYPSSLSLPFGLLGKRHSQLPSPFPQHKFQEEKALSAKTRRGCRHSLSWVSAKCLMNMNFSLLAFPEQSSQGLSKAWTELDWRTLPTTKRVASTCSCLWASASLCPMGCRFSIKTLETVLPTSTGKTEETFCNKLDKMLPRVKS